nr:MAG TPA: hypothetical protein [Caudoviricetes sp.]
MVNFLNKYDLEHKLLKGSPLLLGNILTYKVTLGEMVDHGFTQMQNVIYILCMEDEKAADYMKKPFENPSTFLYVYANMFTEYTRIKNGQINDKDTPLSNSILSFLSLFFKREVTFNPNYGFIIDGKSGKPSVLAERNYDEFRTILKERNCLINLDDINEDNPNNEITRKLLEKRKKLREKIKKAKHANEDEDGLSMADLISIFAEAEHMPLQEVYEKYDIYQFNNQFNRLKIMDDFHVNIQALLAGAKDKDFKIQHWLSKLNKQDD